jgi:hypothetical protein
MNKGFEQRLRRLEQQQGRRAPKKRMLPDWLLDRWHEETGLAFDTDEKVRESFQQQPEYRDAQRRNTAPARSK